ncbi:hypothetical protein Aduo_010250 [Ancylostoma duodenale]
MEDGTSMGVVDLIYPSVYRVTTPRDEKQGTHSVFRLILPAEFSTSSIDTRLWRVDKNYLLPNTYYHLVTETLFFADAVKLSRHSRANVLLIGLGGGTVNGFLHYNFPEMNITVVEISAQMISLAKKWYDLHTDDHHRVIHADGVIFLKQQAEKGMKYDAVLLDACHSRPQLSRKFMCPVEVFLERRVLRSIAQVVDKKGIFAANILSYQLSNRKIREVLRRKFSKYFAHCRTEMIEPNQVFFCMHQSQIKKKHVDLFKFISDNPLYRSL